MHAFIYLHIWKLATFIMVSFVYAYIQTSHINAHINVQLHENFLNCAYMEERIYKSMHIWKHTYIEACIYGSTHIHKTPLWKWPTPVYVLSVYVHLRKSLSISASSVYAHIQKRAYTKGAYIDDAYMCIRGGGHILYIHHPYMHLPYMWIYGSRILYMRHMYMHIYETAHIRKKFMIIQMHLLYMRASIHAYLRNFSSINAHLYAHLYVSYIRKRAYTEDAIMEVASFHICIVCVCAFTEVIVRI